MSTPLPGTPLPAILVASNVLLAGAAVFLGFKDRQSAAVTSPPPAQPNLAPLVVSMGELDKNLARQAEATLRLNTTLVQYDFLQKELERLSRLEQALVVRANAVTAARTEKNEGDSNKALEKIKEIQGQVQAELQRRKETLLKLIAGLEKNLAASTLDEKALKEVLKPSTTQSSEGASDATEPEPSSAPKPANP